MKVLIAIIVTIIVVVLLIIILIIIIIVTIIKVIIIIVIIITIKIIIIIVIITIIIIIIVIIVIIIEIIIILIKNLDVINYVRNHMMILQKNSIFVFMMYYYQDTNLLISVRSTFLHTFIFLDCFDWQVFECFSKAQTNIKNIKLQ